MKPGQLAPLGMKSVALCSWEIEEGDGGTSTLPLLAEGKLSEGHNFAWRQSTSSTDSKRLLCYWITCDLRAGVGMSPGSGILIEARMINWIFDV